MIDAILIYCYPLRGLLFLLPLNPLLSSVAASDMGDGSNLCCAPKQKRWALWPLAMVILVDGSHLVAK
ncbi:hypothetical protein [Synechococcus sp.]|uniref:hypothetical protein n=1 Tax=Synechococcus sp. TaxID=1131 RepID=UPI0034A2786F